MQAEIHRRVHKKLETVRIEKLDLDQSENLKLKTGRFPIVINVQIKMDRKEGGINLRKPMRSKQKQIFKKEHIW